MRAFIWTFTILWIIDAICRLILLASNNYPRTPSAVRANHDVVRLIFNAALIGWAFYLLFQS